VWDKDWGVNLQGFGDGERAIQYLGAYVCRTAIGDSRIVGIEGDEVTFRWKDRAAGGASRTETIPGVDFVRRYLRHVLPRGMKAIRYHGFCHPAAKAKREQLARLTLREPPPPPAADAPAPPRPCPCCGSPMVRLLKLLPAWRRSRADTAPAPAARPPPVLPAARSCA
jgi:hypothetical protein